MDARLWLDPDLLLENQNTARIFEHKPTRQMQRLAAQLAILQLEQKTIDDAAALYSEQFKETGITVETMESRVNLQAILAESCFAAKAGILVKRTFEKAIDNIARTTLDLHMDADTIEWMGKVLTLEGPDNAAWKRLHGARFPRELTEAGWRHSFAVLSNHVNGFLD